MATEPGVNHAAFSADELLTATGGRLTEPVSVWGVTTDSRRVNPGELFVALSGDNFDAHAFVPQAFARGAAAALVSRPVDGAAGPLLVVEDTLRAFQELARFHRERFGLPVVALTGSNGKTSTKEMIAAVLEPLGPVHRTAGNLNNHVGVPYTILRADNEDRWLVLELGMNHAGELRTLTHIAKPDVAALTIVAPAHLQYFESIDAIADAKFEIFEGLAEGGQVILNGECAEISKALTRHNLTAKTLRFGNKHGFDGQLVSVKSLGFEGLEIEFQLKGERIKASSTLIGTHNALNIVAAALIAKTLVPEIDAAQIVHGISNFRAPLMRLNLKELKDGRTIIDDCYNANPTSMRSSIEFLGELRAAGKRVGMILGDMLELGQSSARYHTEIGKTAAQVRPEYVIAVGPAAVDIYKQAKALGVKAFHAESAEAAAETARKMPVDVLLVKASRGIGLDRAVRKFLERED